MAARPEIRPNRRGVKSRELVLDAAERVMAEHGYDGTSVGRIVEEAGIPLSSVYHYFGSKNGVLLAVMERGAVRFFSSLRLPQERVGTPEEHFEACVTILSDSLQENPDFLRLLIVLALQPPTEDEHDIHAVIERLRDTARAGLASQVAIAFGIRPDSKKAKELARVGLAYIDGAFIASQSGDHADLKRLLAHLPAGVVAVYNRL